jgi:hypothetical protein
MREILFYVGKHNSALCADEYSQMSPSPTQNITMIKAKNVNGTYVKFGCSKCLLSMLSFFPTKN